MSRVRSEDTRPEMKVRSVIHRLGFRYRLHRKDLPGTPDLVFPGRKKVILVHGCFWHGHRCRRGSRVPATNRDYWLGKIERNRARDRTARSELSARGWKSLVLWECQIRDEEKLGLRVARFLLSE